MPVNTWFLVYTFSNDENLMFLFIFDFVQMPLVAQNAQIAVSQIASCFEKSKKWKFASKTPLNWILSYFQC